MIPLNTDNLIPFNELTEDKQREIAKKGGKASVKARQERKALKDELLLLLSKGDTQQKVSLALIQQALNGNTKAFEVIRDTIGEKPKEEYSINVNLNNPYANLNEKQLKKLAGE